jgi:hypothetical protein
MVAWLNEDDDRMMDIDLWGVKKDVYNFGDLAMWLQNGGTLDVESDGDYKDKKSKGRKGKEKRKEQPKVQEKRKEKGKEREQDKEKRAHKKKKNNSQKLT